MERLMAGCSTSIPGYVGEVTVWLDDGIRHLPLLVEIVQRDRWNMN